MLVFYANGSYTIYVNHVQHNITLLTQRLIFEQFLFTTELIV